MINLRAGDVDQAVLPIDSKHIPAILRQVLEGKKPSMASLWNSLQQQGQATFRFNAAVSMMEKSARIPTSMGVPLRVLSVVPILANIDGSVRVSNEGSQGPKITISAQPMVTAAHVQKMESWMCNSFGEWVMGGRDF
jgi:Domain of unknown function (DUF1943)